MIAESSDSEMTVRQAGRLGGQTTRLRYGSEHFAEIGRKGGKTVSRDPEHMSEIGRKGGQARSHHA